MPIPEPEQMAVEWRTRLNQGLRAVLLKKGTTAEEADRIAEAMRGSIRVVSPLEEG
jgi:hypothetical protein